MAKKVEQKFLTPKLTEAYIPNVSKESKEVDSMIASLVGDNTRNVSKNLDSTPLRYVVWETPLEMVKGIYKRSFINDKGDYDPQTNFILDVGEEEYMVAVGGTKGIIDSFAQIQPEEEVVIVFLGEKEIKGESDSKKKKRTFKEFVVKVVQPEGKPKGKNHDDVPF